MEAALERQRALQDALDKPVSSKELLDAANFVDAVLARVEREAPGSFARAQMLISVAATHSVLHRPTTSTTIATVACHIPAVRQLIAALADGDRHIVLAGATAIAAISGVLDVSGTRYGSELALSLSLLEARSSVEPLLGSSCNALATFGAAGAHCFARVGKQLLAVLRARQVH
jgi:hypothetical protein